MNRHRATLFAFGLVILALLMASRAAYASYCCGGYSNKCFAPGATCLEVGQCYCYYPGGGPGVYLCCAGRDYTCPEMVNWGPC